MADKEQSNLEKGVQSIFVSITLALLLWVGYSVTGITNTVGKLTVEMAYVKSATIESQKRFIDGMGDRYTATDASKTREAFEGRARVFEARLSSIEATQNSMAIQFYKDLDELKKLKSLY